MNLKKILKIGAISTGVIASLIILFFIFKFLSEIIEERKLEKNTLIIGLDSLKEINKGVKEDIEKIVQKNKQDSLFLVQYGQDLQNISDDLGAILTDSKSNKYKSQVKEEIKRRQSQKNKNDELKAKLKKLDL